MIIHTHIIRDLEELSDFEYQKQAWLALGPAQNLEKESSIVEAGCRLFVDSGLGTALNSGHVVYAIGVDDDLRKLREMIEDLYYKVASLDDLQTRSMQQVRSQARHILSSIVDTKGTEGPGRMK
jgi:hypothetical protein